MSAHKPECSFRLIKFHCCGEVAEHFEARRHSCIYDHTCLFGFDDVDLVDERLSRRPEPCFCAASRPYASRGSVFPTSEHSGSTEDHSDQELPPPAPMPKVQVRRKRNRGKNKALKPQDYARSEFGNYAHNTAGYDRSGAPIGHQIPRELIFGRGRSDGILGHGMRRDRDPLLDQAQDRARQRRNPSKHFDACRGCGDDETGATWVVGSCPQCDPTAHGLDDLQADALVETAVPASDEVNRQETYPANNEVTMDRNKPWDDAIKQEIESMKERQVFGEDASFEHVGIRCMCCRRPSHGEVHCCSKCPYDGSHTAYCDFVNGNRPRPPWSPPPRSNPNNDRKLGNANKRR